MMSQLPKFTENYLSSNSPIEAIFLPPISYLHKYKGKYINKKLDCKPISLIRCTTTKKKFIISKTKQKMFTKNPITN